MQSDLSNLTDEEIVAKVENGEIQSCKYESFTEYVKGMESD